MKRILLDQQWRETAGCQQQNLLILISRNIPKTAIKYSRSLLLEVVREHRE